MKRSPGLNYASSRMVAVFAVAAMAQLSGCGSILGDDSIASFDSVDEWQGAASFAETFELQVPDSARDIYLSQGGFQDPFYQVRYTIDQDDLPLLESSVGCGGFQPETKTPGPLSFGPENDHDWWQPENADGIRCVGYDRSSRSSQLAIDLNDDDSAVVYIWAFLT